jgi:uncharacterized protein (TIGR02246 family)
MRTSLRLAALCLLLAACSVEKAAPRAGSAANPSAELAEFWQTYAAAQRAADTTAWKALLTDDVVYVFTGAPTLRGRDQATALLAAFLAEHKVAAVHVTSEEVTPAGDRAFQLATVHEAYQKTGQPVTEEFARMAAFFVKSGDGRWLLDRAMVIVDSTITR